LTAIHVQDTASTEEIQSIAPELIDDQARCLLEDMPVSAIMVGPLYTAESVSVLAQIAADYSQVPFVLHLGPLPDDSLLQDIDIDDVVSSLFELLLPQTDIVIADHHLMEQWRTHGLFSGSTADTPADALLQFGASWVLTTAAPLRGGQGHCILAGQGKQSISWPWKVGSVRLSDADGPLACAITTQLARGDTVQAAVETAIGLSSPLASRSFQPGMGHRLINRTHS
jgi:hydroxymethylpyrimidine/phosphomethylpyrimidine kinase